MKSRLLSILLAGCFGAWHLPATRAQKGASSDGSQVSLRQAAHDRKLVVGTAVFPEGLQDEAYARLLAREFNSLTPKTS